MWGNKKYKLIRDEQAVIDELVIDSDEIYSPWRNRFYRLQALRDIPEHGVKAGDLGGLISRCNKGKILSHEGSCWIGYGARVAGYVYITDDVYIGGNALVFNSLRSCSIKISEFVSITGDAELRRETWSLQDSTISGNVKISGSAVVLNPEDIRDAVKIHGNPFVQASHLSGSTEISGTANIETAVKISGDSKILDRAVVKQYADLIGATVKGNAQIGSYEKFHNIVCDKGLYSTFSPSIQKVWVTEYNYPDHALERKGSVSAITATVSPKTEINAENQEETEQALALFSELNESIASYETDIVKIIKYPVMTDRTNIFTRDMVKAHGLVKRLSSTPQSDKFIKAVGELEDAFLAAESNAIKLASTMLSVEDMKKTKDAKVMLAKASNEASSETEKKMAFTQAFKQLEGVITVPEIAVDAFRVKIGLKEIEA